MKKLLSLLFSCALCCVLTGCSLFFAKTSKLINYNIMDQEFLSTYNSSHGELEYLQPNTYMATSLFLEGEHNTIIIPSMYDDTPVTAIGDEFLSNTEIKTLVLSENTNFIGINLCGMYDSCSSLETIVCLNPEPFYLGSLALDSNQLAGGCKIYVLDQSVNAYKSSDIGILGFSTYEELIVPYSTLDAETKEYIEENLT